MRAVLAPLVVTTLMLSGCALSNASLPPTVFSEEAEAASQSMMAGMRLCFERRGQIGDGLHDLAIYRLEPNAGVYDVAVFGEGSETGVRFKCADGSRRVIALGGLKALLGDVQPSYVEVSGLHDTWYGVQRRGEPLLVSIHVGRGDLQDLPSRPRSWVTAIEGVMGRF